MIELRTVGRIAIGILAAAVAAAVGWALFVEFPTDATELAGVLLVVGSATLGLRVGQTLVDSVVPEYNAAEVAVEGPITRDGGGGVPFSAPGTPGADDIVELIERADEDDNAEALLLRLNTPGGAVVPSDDIRRAAEQFDGPTIAYATDVCASGGYWIASGCDELWARHGSIVGSIGVRGSRMTASELLDEVGLEYEQFTAGRYKEAGVPFTDLDPDERSYLQGLIDDYYDRFVETVAEGRDLDDQMIRDTEAKVFLGEEAADLGLVDAIGTRDDVRAHLEDIIEADVEATELEPRTSLAERVRGGAERAAYAAGSGLASQFVDVDDEFRFRI